MARKRRKDNEEARVSYDYSKNGGNGSVGLSAEAQRALDTGSYGSMNTRKAQYNTSQEQTQQAKSLPVLKGISIPESNTDAWESNFSKNKSYIDTDHARRKYAENYTPLGQEETSSARDENYVVKRDRYDKLMKDNRLANDIKTLAEVNYKNANQDATVSQEWADEYGAKKITGGYSKSQFIDTLSRRYGLTPKELNDMALTFHSDSYKKENEEYGKNLEKIGKDHALLGSAGSLVGTIGSGFEGMYNAAVGGLMGDDRYLSNIFSTTKNKPREGAKQNIKSDLGKGAYDVVMGIGDMAAGAATGSAPVILAGNTANEAISSAMERGSGVRRSAAYGTAAGLLDFVTNKIGLDAAKKKAVDSIKSTGIKKFLKQNAIAGLGEAGENIIQDIGQSFFDAIINGKNSELSKSYADKVASGMSEDDAFSAVAKEYVGQLGMSGALGFGMGSAMQAGTTALPKIPELVSQKLAYNNVGALDPSIREILFGDSELPVVKKATNQAETAKAEIENLSRQIPETRTDLDNYIEAIARPEGNAEAVYAIQKQLNNPDFKPITFNTDDGSTYILSKSTRPGEKWQLSHMADTGEFMGHSATATNEELLKLIAKAKSKISNLDFSGSSEGIFNPTTTTLGEMLNNPSQYTYEDFSRAMRTYDHNASPEDFELEDIIYALSQTVEDDPDLADMTVRMPNGVPTSTGASAPSADNFNLTPKVEQNRNNVPPTDIPNNPNVPPADGNMGMSKVITNSAKNAGIVTPEQIDNDPVIKSIAEYAKHNNETTLDAAKQNVAKNGAQMLDDFNSGKTEINSDQTVDESFLLLRSLTNQIEELGENAPEDLIQKKNLLLSRLRKAGTKYGQTIQAFAKWNKTPEGAIVNGQKILDERTSKFKSRNKKAVEQNNKLAEELDNIGREDFDTTISNGGGYKKSNGKSDSEKTSSRLDKALRQQGYDGTMESEPKAPKTHEQHRVEVENSIRKELGSVADQFNDNDFEYLTSLVESKQPVDIITDEIEHRLNHGEWYTIDESTPVKKATSSKLSKILKNMGDDSLKEKNRPQETGYPKKSHATISEEVVNTLEKEAAGLGLDTPTDIEFLTMMIEEKVPDWQIEDEINHRLMTGEWYTLDESIEPKAPISQKLKNALDSLVEEKVKPEKAELTIDEIREQVRNTLNRESASAGISRLYTDLGEYTDADVDYLSYLIKNGATKQELADALNTKLATGTFAISPATEQKVVDLFKYAEKAGMNSKNGMDAMSAAYKLIADETVGNASAFEKFEAWRYLAMLGNTKTMARNMVGNVLFNATTDFSNGLSALIESGVDKTLKKFGGEGIQRQKAILNPTEDANLIKTAWKDGTQNRWSEINGTKYEKGVKDAIRSQKSVFDSKLLQLYERATDAGISDEKFVHAKYSTSLAGYLKANGLGEDAFRAEPRYSKLMADSQMRVLTDAERAEMENLRQTIATLDKARDYAIKQAEYATFHEDNAVAQWLSKNIQEARNSDNAALRGIGTIAEGVLPFKKTPANILKSGFEYSPLGAIKSIAETGKLIYENTGSRKGNLEDVYQKTNKVTGKTRDVSKSLASDVIESWSKTLTGSGLALLGYYLADKGILRGGGDDDKYQNDLEGKQQYSIEINGKTYTVDWAAPAVMPMLLGAEANKIAQDNLVSNESVFSDIDSAMGSLNALLDPILETSFMQGVQNALESAANQVRFGGDGKGVPGGIAGAFASNALASYATQGIPTFLGQIARTVDPIRRATDTGTESNFLSEFEKTARKTANKIPFLSKMVNEPYYDAYGRTQNNSPFENPLANFAYQALSPSYVADINETQADKSARDAYNGLVPVVDENGNTTMQPLRDAKAFASWKNKVTINGKQLKPKEIAEYRKTTGETNYAIRTALAKEDWFSELSPTKQTEILNKVNNLVDKVGKEKYTPGTGKDYEAYKEGGIPSLLDYYKNSGMKKEVQEKTGLNATSNAAKTIMADLESGNKAEAEQKIDEATQLADLGFTKPGPTDTYYKAKGIVPELTPDEFARTYKAIDADGNQGIKQDEVLAYLNKGNYTEAEGVQIWNMYAPKGKKVPYIKEDGTWGKH